MKGSYTPIHKTDAISEHLKIVEVKCDVVDEKVSRVLKLLSTFNIRKLTSNTITFLSISKVWFHVHMHERMKGQIIQLISYEHKLAC